MQAAVFLSTIITLMSIEQGEGARILGFFPMPVKSHHRVFQPVLRALAEKGHQVTYFTPFTMHQPPPTLKHVIVKNYMGDIMQQLQTIPDLMKNWLTVTMGEITVCIAEKVLQDDEFQKLISSSSEFDLILSEMTVLHEPFSPLIHLFNAVSIEILPSGNLHWTWSLHGNPYDTSYIIDTSVMYADRMNLIEKVHNTMNSLAHRFILHHCYMPKYQRLADMYFRYPGWERRPAVNELLTNTSLVLVNSHFSLNYPYPQATNFKDIGGINLQPESTPLSQDMKEFMDGATDGIIYFTLGSHADVSKTLGEELRKAFTKSFSSLKQRVLWKWESEFPDLPKNIRISKWFPQQDILAHKNMKLFITHGGFLSLTEAVYNGVPLIAIPQMGDQFKNAKHIENFGYGIQLYLHNITAESLSWSINHVLSHESFTENAKKRSQLFRDKPETALETAVFWTEYVIRHNGAHHLKPAIATMPWYQQAMLDVYLTIAIIILLPLYVFYRMTKLIFDCLIGLSKNKRKKD